MTPRRVGSIVITTPLYPTTSSLAPSYHHCHQCSRVSDERLANPPPPCLAATGSNRDDQPGYFADPMIGNYRLDMCAYFPSPGQPDVSSCGKPAADLFCQKHGFKSAASFEGYSGYGKTTISIGDNKLNTVKTQDAIKNIQCV